MTGMDFVIRHMAEHEVALAVDWAAAEGWNPGINDAKSFWCADRLGFLLGLKDGRPVACISAVRYGSLYGFIGFYIVKPEYRGQGYGLRLWQRAMEQLAGRVVGLDGVVAQQKNYQKSGFELAYSNIRFSGVFSGNCSELGSKLRPDVTIIPAKQINQNELITYDSSLFFTTRAEFLSNWVAQPQAVALAAVQSGRLVGYGVIRQCRSGHKIGPLFAEDAAIAEKLLLSLAGSAGGQQVFLDVPEVNAQGLELAAKYKMATVFGTARMYKGAALKLPLDKIFGVTTFELG